MNKKLKLLLVALFLVLALWYLYLYLIYRALYWVVCALVVFFSLIIKEHDFYQSSGSHVKMIKWKKWKARGGKGGRC